MAVVQPAGVGQRDSARAVGSLVSIPIEEARATRRAWKFLLGLSSGEVKLRPAANVRAEARDIVKHFPLGGDLEGAAKRYAPELLSQLEDEADQLAQECARESARASAAETRVEELEPTIPPDFLNMP